MMPRDRLMGRARDERGDTLIELLLAVVIIALAAAPLVGALLESIAASAEHRGIATADSVLKKFAETASAEIETSKVPYQATTSPSYRLMSNPSRLSGPATTTVATVFVTGFSASDTSSSFSVTVGASPATIRNVTVYGPGAARITFVVPSGLAPSATPYTIKVSDPGGTAKSLTGFTVKSGTPSNQGKNTPYSKGYSIKVQSVKCWTKTGGAFATCTTANKGSGLQFLSFTARGPYGTSGTLGIVVRNPART